MKTRKELLIEIKRLTRAGHDGQKKAQELLLEEAGLNYRTQHPGWKEKNLAISKGIGILFKALERE